MATIQEIIQSPEFNIIHLVAGHKGAYRKIAGINVVENKELTLFCRPNELIVTTGVQIQDDQEKLEELIRSACSKRVAGFVINTGPYITHIPDSIIAFANEQEIPIFQMNWEYRVADLLKITFQFISSYQQQQSSEEKLLTNLLFNYNKYKDSLPEALQQHGFPKGTELGIITCATISAQNNIIRYEGIITAAFQNRYQSFLCLKYKNQLIYLINRAGVKTQSIPFSKTANAIYEKIIKKNGSLPLIIGMGNFYTELPNVVKSYEQSLTVIQLAQLHDNRFLFKYNEIGAYKIIMGVQDRRIIETFRQDILGSLYQYDQIHQTDLVDFLRIYLRENGSTTKISKLKFIHRNTVLYKIKKLEALLDMDLTDTFAKTNLSIALMIEDVMNQK